MAVELNPTQARVIGCLMEKSVITPDQYPLTLNALTNACNQKSSREPVMSLTQGDVQHTVRSLQDLHLVRVEENFKTRVEKYTQRLCNTPFSDYQFDQAEFAIVCVLLLRGPRTPGELRANSGRLHTFEDNQAVEEASQGLLHRDGGPVVAKLPRIPGRRDAQYMHLLSGEVSSATQAAADAPAPSPAVPTDISAQATEGEPTLAQRVTQLEQEVEQLRAQISRMMSSE